MRKILIAVALLTIAFIPAVALGQAQAGEPCGDTLKVVCAEGLYCAYAHGTCGKDDKPGKCEPKTEICNLIYAPVCGCDGKTHGSDCAAAAAGQSIAADGECSVKKN